MVRIKITCLTPLGVRLTNHCWDYLGHPDVDQRRIIIKAYFCSVIRTNSTNINLFTFQEEVASQHHHGEEGGKWRKLQNEKDNEKSWKGLWSNRDDISFDVCATVSQLLEDTHHTHIFGAHAFPSRWRHEYECLSQISYLRSNLVQFGYGLYHLPLAL